jgi:predicted nucleotidyltransferase
MEAELRRQGLLALFLFGSVARDEAAESSDIDLLFEVSPDVRFSLFDQARVRSDLVDRPHADVDLVPIRGLRPKLRARAEAEAVQVF